MPTIKKLPKRKQTYNPGTGRRAERQAIYNTTRWRSLSHAKFLEQPLCEMCEKKGIATPATQIHHIVSFMSVDDPIARKVLAYDYNNLMSICQDCHNAIHNGFDIGD